MRKKVRQKSFDFLSLGSPSGENLDEKLDGFFSKDIQVNINNVDRSLFDSNNQGSDEAAECQSP